MISVVGVVIETTVPIAPETDPVNDWPAVNVPMTFTTSNTSELVSGSIVLPTITADAVFPELVITSPLFKQTCESPEIRRLVSEAEPPTLVSESNCPEERV